MDSNVDIEYIESNSFDGLIPKGISLFQLKNKK